MSTLTIDEYLKLPAPKKQKWDEWLRAEGLIGEFVRDLEVIDDHHVRARCYKTRDGKRYVTSAREPAMHWQTFTVTTRPPGF
jgi:hypothetical protein